MKHTVKLLLLLFICFSTSPAISQNEGDIRSDTRAAIQEWEGYAEVLSTYQGLSQYCRDRKFRDNVVLALNNIHHYDSLILDRTVDKNTTKDIKEFEKKYSVSSFRVHLKKECHERREVEREKKNNPGGFAPESYDAQKLIVETEVQRYIKHINKVVVHIDHDLKR